MASTQSISVSPFPPARRSRWPRCRLKPALRSTRRQGLRRRTEADLMKYTFHIVDVFTSTPFGGNQLAVLPDAAGISTEGMQKIAREFNFGETTFVLPKNDPANTCRVRIFTPRAELDFAGHPTVGTACALVMKQHVRLGDPIRLVLEENIGPVTVDVAQRNGGFHGTLTLSEKIDAPTGAPSPTDLPPVFSFAGKLRDGGKLHARMWAPALGVEEDPATGSACAALVGAMASKPDFGGTAYRLSIQQGVSMGRRSEIEAEARKSRGVLTSVSVSGATAYIASGEIEVPPSALVS